MSKLYSVALAAFCLALFTGQSARAEDDAYTVIIKKVEVKTTKKDGSAWDVDNGKPDIAVTVRNYSDKDSKSFTTKTVDDSYTAEFKDPTTIKIRPGQELEIEVLDKDVAVNDTIGKTRKEMTAELLKAGKIKFEKFDQVVYVEVEFKKL